MKLDAHALVVFKNFATINPSIVVREGSTLSAISPSKSVLARAKLNVEFPATFGIFDLSKFLSVLSLFDDPDLDINEKSMTIKKDRAKVQYIFADTDILLAAPDKDIPMPDADIEATITENDLASVQKALGVLGLPEIAISGDGETLRISAVDSANIGKENKVSDSFSIEIGTTDKNFTAVFKAENIKFIPGEYKVLISNKGISRFEGKDVTYWVAVEKGKSVFN